MNTDKPKNSLYIHRVALSKNPMAYTFSLERERLGRTAVAHLKKCGYRRVTRDRCALLVDEFIDKIFATQDQKPFFHIESELPYCWNAPKDWGKDFIVYEWGHLRSRNQNNNPYQIDNLCLQSARCNQHIQTSMDIKEVLKWLDGSRVADRINYVLNKRELLFASDEWKQLVIKLDQYK